MIETVIAGVVVLLSVASADSNGTPGDGVPLKYISSCEIDLNADGEADIALLVETVRGRELIVLMRKAGGYETFLLSDDLSNMYLSCHYGATVTSFPKDAPGQPEGRTYQTPGTYIELFQPEVSAVAYFWNGSGFTEVWTSD